MMNKVPLLGISCNVTVFIKPVKKKVFLETCCFHLRGKQTSVAFFKGSGSYGARVKGHQPQTFVTLQASFAKIEV